MKKTFLKIGLLLTLGLTTAVFNSCTKDDESDNGKAGTITATNVVNSSSQIATVKAEVWYNDNKDVLAEAQYKNNGFTLKLPATVDAKYLESMFEDDEDMAGVTVSDKTAKGFSISKFRAYDKNDKEIGRLMYASADPSSDNNDNYSGAMWLYVDKNVTIKGQNKDKDEEYNEEYIANYNLTLKKGWNICYISETYTNNKSAKTYTTTVASKKPSVTLKWYFYGYDNEDYATILKSTKSLSKRKSCFTK